MTTFRHTITDDQIRATADTVKAQGLNGMFSYCLPILDALMQTALGTSTHRPAARARFIDIRDTLTRHTGDSQP